MDKDATRASMIWRLSINSAPVMQNIFNHFSSRCSAGKILRLIKDIKNVALVGEEKDFLNSYNVKQAMIWCLHQNPDIPSEPDIIEEKKTLPSFLEKSYGKKWKARRCQKKSHWYPVKHGKPQHYRTPRWCWDRSRDLFYRP